MRYPFGSIIVILLSSLSTASKAQTVALDYYFNHESRKAKNGTIERFHYTWEDETNTGFSLWGNGFKKLGAKLTAIEGKPTAHNLSKVDIYIMPDPDSKKENPDPNYISSADADVIAQWVKKGGVLILMANDSANTELQHFNILAAKFGMHFNDDLQNHVVDDAHFEDGAITINHNRVFTTAKKIFMKDVCSIGLKQNAKPLLKASNSYVIAATAQCGKGTVIAIGDPWLYNEYVNGRLPAGYENDKAMTDLARYAILLRRHSSSQ